MTTIGYCAPEPDGQMHENMLCMDERIEAPLGGLIRAVQGSSRRTSENRGLCKATRPGAGA